MKLPDHYVAWDLETTGFEPEFNRIIEIGAIEIGPEGVIRQKNWLLNHGIEIPPKITEITTITKELIEKEGVNPKEAIDEFLGWLEPVGWANLTHNGFRFDIPFLLASLTRDSTFDSSEAMEIRRHLYTHGTDTAAIYKGRKLGMAQQPGEQFLSYARRVLDTKKFGLKYSISTCCDDLKIDRRNMQLHRALGDVFLTNEIYKKLYEA